MNLAVFPGLAGIRRFAHSTSQVVPSEEVVLRRLEWGFL